jgi:predicted RNA polymerase sigma factor
VSLEVPAGAELTRRLAGVLHALYLLFNAGYDSEQPAAPIRQDLCAEALRLGHLLTQHPRTDLPDTHALLALFCLQAARLPARTDAHGHLVLLEDQDRAAGASRSLPAGCATWAGPPTRPKPAPTTCRRALPWSTAAPLRTRRRTGPPSAGCTTSCWRGGRRRWWPCTAPWP